MIETLRSKIRPVKDEDRQNLITISYSKLDVEKKCPFKYDLIYNQKNFPKRGSIATDIGNLVHWCLEQKGLSKLKAQPVSYEDIIECAFRGVDSLSAKGQNQHIFGIDEIKEMYPDDFYLRDDASGMNYEEKLELFFNNVLPDRMEDINGWTTWGVEQQFEFVYDDRCIIHGFIDRIDVSMDNGKPIIRVVDYKSSKKPYPESQIKTPMQFIIYDLACVHLMNALPSAHMYDFVLINEKQSEDDGLCTFGYLNRGIRALDSILDSIKDNEENGNFIPKPSPLCYYCDFCKNNPNALDKYKRLCPYYSLWSPTNKTYEVNMKYDPEKKPRILDFDF